MLFPGLLKEDIRFMILARRVGECYRKGLVVVKYTNSDKDWHSMRVGIEGRVNGIVPVGDESLVGIEENLMRKPDLY